MKIITSTMHDIIDGTNILSTGNTEELYFRCGDIEIARTTLKTPRGGPWIFKLAEDFTLETDCTGITFRSDWFAIAEDGRMTIRKGYAWDGNSVKLDVFDLFIIGTPDGVIDVQTMKPKTWYASLVHDALYQYYGYHGILRSEMDKIYLLLARKADFFPAPLYYAVIRLLGWAFFAGKRKELIPAADRTILLFREFLGRENR